MGWSHFLKILSYQLLSFQAPEAPSGYLPPSQSRWRHSGKGGTLAAWPHPGPAQAWFAAPSRKSSAVGAGWPRPVGRWAGGPRWRTLFRGETGDEAGSQAFSRGDRRELGRPSGALLPKAEFSRVRSRLGCPAASDPRRFRDWVFNFRKFRKAAFRERLGCSFLPQVGHL